ncbi:hypothetical protein B0H94_10975 [Salsuginibacillus halophilus]|uniref:Phosphoesterase n=1 Tax=Salsuginibacillus halophilus TaxID=517424 RepID=A0A2P8HCR0_9BACI|nr:metallophosphoesterase [Salsuginibacillus halophilus]PSL44016.1 hypothetical protein B0H94_10975 [Salsuginibacillus halophilus]
MGEKLLVMSDSHGAVEEVAKVYKRHEAEVQAVIHCGDSELKASAPELENFYVVNGNCDPSGTFPEEITVQAGGLNVFAAHGHLLNVKMSHQSLLYKAEESEASLACFGHSHVPEAYKVGSTVLLNPGSLLFPRQTTIPSYAIVTTGDGQVVEVRFYETKTGSEIEDWQKHF